MFFLILLLQSNSYKIIGFFYFHGLQAVVAVFEQDDIAVGSAHTVIIPDAVVLDVLNESFNGRVITVLRCIVGIKCHLHALLLEMPGKYDLDTVCEHVSIV